MSQKISQLPSVIAANVADTDILPLVATNITSKVTVANLRTKLGTQPPTGGRTVTDAFTYLTNNAVFNVKDFGAFGDGTTNDTTTIQNAINAAGAVGGIVFFPAGVYKTTAALTVPRWVRLKGENATGVAGGTTWNGVTVIHAVHTGNAILDFSGVQAAGAQDIKLYGDQTTTPKTGMLLGRTSAASAGFHVFDNVSVEGYFTKAAIYSIASEENRWLNPHVSLLGGGALYCFYTSQGDDLSVAGLTGSSNIHGVLRSPWMSSQVNDATSALIFINAGAGTFSWTFDGGYLLPKSGAYVAIKTGAVDASDTPGQFVFTGISGEKVSGGLNPVTGFDLLVSGTHTLHGLQIHGCSFELDGAAGRMYKQAATLTLDGCDMQSFARGGIGSSLVTGQITNSRINDGFTAVMQLYGDVALDTGKVSASGLNTAGYYFGQGGPRFRLQSVANQIQATDNAGSAFYDVALKTVYIAGATPIFSGTGSPETVVTAPVGSLFLRTDSATSLYVKQTGAGNTGWVAK